jgi:hypothetical protein
VSDYLQGRWRLVDAGRFTRRAQLLAMICPPLATTLT